ncbi:CAMKK/CAMKK-META protein kinase [Puccinia triticina 1-1 BBBD Race 1]|uniref:CAMKK/CAMKK-META protein kinase n=1 Tax=Puccinia triticina (isolate 1-1 / race 1 (BBBD)) TaxID=630390 RepID=A0A180G2G3_PUCT1|nr:CAMKK/CAMKK-META protein kinase [Puccinia triticina 1-1 BBBD Race 1]
MTATTNSSPSPAPSSRSLTAYSCPPSTSRGTSPAAARTRKLSATNPPPAILPKLSAKLPSRLKRPSLHHAPATPAPLPVPPSPSHPSPPFRQTLHASLSQDGLDSGQRRLNQYLLLKTIGRGSFGSVELAQDTSIVGPDAAPGKALYAIKEYSKSRMRKRARILNHRSRIMSRSASSNQSPTQPTRLLSESSEGILLVKEEVAIMKKLSHPNIVSLLEVIDTDQDSLFFVLELCPYGPVMQIQPNESTPPLSEGSARNVFRQMILGIEYLHFNQVIHRDIKPDNILYFDNPALRPDPLCKIVDFGVSESFAKPGDDMMHKSAGSPAFLAPEVCMGIGEGVHGRIADIWAMGITLYALVCGKLPFEGHNQIVLCEKIMNDAPEFPSHLSGSLVELLRSLLTKTPHQRIQMDELRIAKWVTEEGRQPMTMPASDLTPIQPPTEREIMDAFKSLKTIATMFKAIGKFRASKRRSRTSQVTDDVSESLGSSPSGTSRPGSPSSYTDQLVDSPLSSLTFSPRPRAPSIRTRTAPDLASPLRKLTFDTARQPTPLARADPLLTPAHLPSLDQALESFHLAASPVFVPPQHLPPSAPLPHPNQASDKLPQSPIPSDSPVLLQASPSSSPPQSSYFPAPPPP